MGRQTSCTTTAGSTTQRTYNKGGLRTAETDARGSITQLTFDSRGRRIARTDRLGHTTAWSYDATNRLTSTTDPENQITSYAYDDAGRIVLERHPDHQTGSAIGSAGYGELHVAYGENVRTVTDQQGDKETWVMDMAGRRVTRSFVGHESGPLAGEAYSDSFEYDGAGRTVTASSGRYANTVEILYDSVGRKSQESLQLSETTYSVKWAYDPAGNITRITYPDDTQVTREYTGDGRLARVSSDLSEICTYDYSLSPEQVSCTYLNGVEETRSYNDGNLSSIVFLGADIGRFDYTWDENGNRMSETRSGVLGHSSFTIPPAGYDAEDRPTEYLRADGETTNWALSNGD